jgi:glycosyltransferase involved in cell wall biosynthesis
MPSVLVVVPAYNEASRIESSLVALTNFLDGPSFPYPFRVVVADNGSTDETGERAEQFAKRHENISVMKLDARGKGRAIRTAWDSAHEDILAFMDADLSTDLNHFPALIDAIANGTADLAIGNRLGTGSVLLSEKKFRKFASQVYNRCARALLSTKVVDHQCGFKAITRDAYNRLRFELRDTGFFFDTELMAHARDRGMRISELDVRWVDAPDSKVSLLTAPLAMLCSMLLLAIRLRFR